YTISRRAQKQSPTCSDLVKEYIIYRTRCEDTIYHSACCLVSYLVYVSHMASTKDTQILPQKILRLFFVSASELFCFDIAKELSIVLQCCFVSYLELSIVPQCCLVSYLVYVAYTASAKNPQVVFVSALELFCFDIVKELFIVSQYCLVSYLDLTSQDVADEDRKPISYTESPISKLLNRNLMYQNIAKETKEKPSNHRVLCERKQISYTKSPTSKLLNHNLTYQDMTKEN
ncbi:25437_t:CDS:2, partial [Racocetra persica]